jgi:hypothetical protein
VVREGDGVDAALQELGVVMPASVWLARANSSISAVMSTP